MLSYLFYNYKLARLQASNALTSKFKQEVKQVKADSVAAQPLTGSYYSTSLAALRIRKLATS